MLWDLPRWLVPYIYLPLGDKTKKEIRAIAAQAELSVAKADSQDICFVPDGLCRRAGARGESSAAFG